MKDNKNKNESKNENKKKKRGVIGWIIVFLLAIMALAGFFAMLMSVTCSYISPERFVWLSFFGLTFWVILFFNVAVLLLLLLMRSRWAWLSVFTLLLAVPGIIKSVSIGKQHDNGELRVMSYNVLRFKNQNDSEKSAEEVAADIAELVKKYDPDVLCLQEFNDFATVKTKNKREGNIKKFGDMIGMPNHQYNKKAYFVGNVIYSKYPLSVLKEDIPLAKENDYGTVAKVDAGEKGEFYVLSCHLTSFRLTKDEISAISEPSSNKDNGKKDDIHGTNNDSINGGSIGKSIVHKLKTAYVNRSEQVVRMLDDIPNDSIPILLCGDFNDTPMSYTYHELRKAGFTDSFVKSGRGIGYTYAGRLPLLRIDYVWTKKIRPMSFQRIKFEGSDHYPILLDFNVSKVENGLQTDI